MALPKKGSRKITVDEIVYRWIVSPNDEPGLGIIVEHAESPGAKMCTWVEHGNIISSWLVRKAIDNALSKGWKPQKPGRKIEFRFEGILLKDTDDSESLLSLRRYQGDDYIAVWNLYNSVLGKVDLYDRSTWDEDLRNLSSFERDCKSEFIVGCLNSQVIATGAFSRISKEKAEISKMLVHLDLQRLGYGQQMLEYLELQIVKSGLKVLTLHTTSIQIVAQKLYKKNGYVEVKRQPWHNMERIYCEKRL